MENVVLDFEKETIALLARVRPARKLSALVFGRKTSDGNTTSSPGAPTFVTVRFAEIATASAGMPHGDAAGSNVRVALACNGGAPSGPVGFLVSRTRHGDRVKKRPAEATTVTVAAPAALVQPEESVSVTESVSGVPAGAPRSGRAGSADGGIEARRETHGRADAERPLDMASPNSRSTRQRGASPLRVVFPNAWSSPRRPTSTPGSMPVEV